MHEIGNSSITNVKSLSHTRTHTLLVHIHAHTHTRNAPNEYVRSRSLILNRWICVCVCGCVFSFQLFFCFLFLLCSISLAFSIAALYSCSLALSLPPQRNHHPSIFLTLTFFLPENITHPRQRIWLHARAGSLYQRLVFVNVSVCGCIWSHLATETHRYISFFHTASSSSSSSLLISLSILQIWL